MPRTSASQLREFRGILPARMYEGCTRNAYHLYMFRYQKEHFANLPRARFLKALSAEGIPCSGGYSPSEQRTPAESYPGIARLSPGV